MRLFVIHITQNTKGRRVQTIVFYFGLFSGFDSRFNALEVPKVNLFAVYGDPCFIKPTFQKSNTWVTSLVRFLNFGIPRILLSATMPKILSPVIQFIAVDVINNDPRIVIVEDHSMHLLNFFLDVCHSIAGFANTPRVIFNGVKIAPVNNYDFARSCMDFIVSASINELIGVFSSSQFSRAVKEHPQIMLIAIWHPFKTRSKLITAYRTSGKSRFRVGGWILFEVISLPHLAPSNFFAFSTAINLHRLDCREYCIAYLTRLFFSVGHIITTFNNYSLKRGLGNIIKNISDCLNGLARHDDSQVCELSAIKYYSEKPGTVVVIETLGGESAA